MIQDFLATLTQTNVASEVAPRHSQRQAKVRVILLGTPEDVTHIIYDLYQRGFAEVGSWSPPQAIPDSDEIIRIQIRRFGRSASSI
jgi:hypothetical protein